jgi:hypothetical protein
MLCSSYRRLFTVFALLLAFPCIAQSADRRITVDTRGGLIRAVRSAQPGTQVLIAPGEYRGELHFGPLAGTAKSPISIAALDAENPPVITGGSFAMHLVRPRHVELRGLHIRGPRGNGLNIDDGGKADSPAEHVRLVGLHIENVGPTGNRDGIKLSGVDKFVIQDCVVRRWGTSGSAIDMVGCHQGRIENCTFQFQDDVFANGVQTKGGSSDVAIRRCRFEHAGNRSINIGGSTGAAYFRPPAPGYEAQRILVEDCTFVGSMAPIAFVGVDGAIVRHNTIYRPGRWVIRILQESQGDEFTPCRNGVFANNLIAFRADEVRSVVNVGGGTSAETFQFSGNHWFCIDRPARSDRLGLPTREQNGSYGVDPKFNDPENGDFRSPISSAGVR